MREELRDASWATSSPPYAYTEVVWAPSGRVDHSQLEPGIGSHRQRSITPSIDAVTEQTSETDGLRRTRLEGMAVSGSNEVPASEDAEP